VGVPPEPRRPFPIEFFVVDLSNVLLTGVDAAPAPLPLAAGAAVALSLVATGARFLDFSGLAAFLALTWLAGFFAFSAFSNL